MQTIFPSLKCPSPQKALFCSASRSDPSGVFGVGGGFGDAVPAVYGIPPAVAVGTQANR